MRACVRACVCNAHRRYGALELARALGFELFRSGEIARPAVWPPAALPNLDRRHAPPFIDRHIISTLVRSKKSFFNTTRLPPYFNTTTYKEYKAKHPKATTGNLPRTAVGGCYAKYEPQLGAARAAYACRSRDYLYAGGTVTGSYLGACGSTMRVRSAAGGQPSRFRSDVSLRCGLLCAARAAPGNISRHTLTVC